MNPGTEEDPRSSSDALRRMPPPGPPQTSAAIGGILAAARQKKGHTIDAVVQQTRIPRKFLAALEENRFEDFPAMVYLRGFLKSYCDFLEVDFEPLWLKVTEGAAAGAPAAAEDAPAPAAPAAGGAAGKAKPGRPPEPRSAPRHAPAPEHGHAEDAASDDGPWGAVAVLAFAAAGCLALAWGLKTRAPAPAPLPPEAVPAALAGFSARPEPRLSLELREEAWVSVSLDGALKFQGRAPQGARQEWKARRFILLRTSDPAALKLALNGSPFELPAPGAAGLYRIESP